MKDKCSQCGEHKENIIINKLDELVCEECNEVHIDEGLYHK